MRDNERKLDVSMDNHCDLLLESVNFFIYYSIKFEIFGPSTISYLVILN